jgi:hypothetical protein
MMNGFAAACVVALALSAAGAEPPASPAAPSPSEVFTRTVLGFTDLVGSITVERFSYWTLPSATDLRCQLKITDTGWRFENVRAKYCGGDMMAEASIDYKKDGRELRFAAEIVGGKLEEFTRQIKYSVTPGRFSGRIGVCVTSAGVEGLHGSAEVHVRDANLGTLPVVLKAFTFLSFPGIEKEELNEVDGHMTLTPRAIVFQSLTLRSHRSGPDSLSLQADRLGSVTYAGDLDLRFKPVIPSRIIPIVPVVGHPIDVVVSGIQQGIMRVRVTGTLTDPKFQWTPFR